MISFIFKSLYQKKNFRNTIKVSNSLDPDEARHLFGPDLIPNCLQRLSADFIRRQIVLHSYTCMQHMYHVGLQVYSAVAQLVEA